VTAAGANGHQAFDLDAAAAAARAEANAQPFVFTWHGAEYVVPAATEWPLSAMTAMSEGNLAAAMSALLGDESYALLAATGITIGALNTLFDAIGKAAGMGGLPNSSASQQPALTRT
jgi:hypothetical protein